MPPKIIPATNHEDYVPEVKKHYKPKELIQTDFITGYFKDRDRVLYKLYPYLRDELKERYKV